MKTCSHCSRSALSVDLLRQPTKLWIGGNQTVLNVPVGGDIGFGNRRISTLGPGFGIIAEVGQGDLSCLAGDIGHQVDHRRVAECGGDRSRPDQAPAMVIPSMAIVGALVA